MNYNFIEQRTHVACCEVFIHHEETVMNAESHAKGVLVKDVAGSTVTMPKGKCVFFCIDTSKIQSSIREIAENISRLEEDLCVNLLRVPPELKIGLCQYVVKYCYKDAVVSNTNFYNIFFRDIPKYKGPIMDMLDETTCANLTRMIENSTDKLNPVKFCQKIKTYFSKKSNIEISVCDRKQIRRYLTDDVVLADDNSRLMTIEMMNDTRFPTVCIIGETVTMCQDKYGMHTYKSGGAVVCGILNYFSRFGKHIKCNIVGILPVLDYMESAKHRSTCDVIRETVLYAQIRYRPKYVLSFASAPDVLSNVENAMVVAYSLHQGLLSNAKHAGDYVGENVIVSNNRDVVNLNTKNVVHFNIINDTKQNQILGNGVSLGIKMVKNFCCSAPKRIKNKYIRI